MTAHDPAAQLEAVFVAEGGRVIAAVARDTGDLDLAEEALQDAVAAACRPGRPVTSPIGRVRGC